MMKRLYMLIHLLCAVIIVQSQITERWIVQKKDFQSLVDIEGQRIKTLRNGLEVWEIPKHLIEQTLSGVSTRASINLVEQDRQYYALAGPNDPLFNEQWAWNNTGQTGGIPGSDIQAVRAWEIATGNDSTIIGLLDSGIDWNHPDLIENIWQNLGEDIDGDGKILEWNGSSWEFDPDDQNGIDDDNNGYADDFIGWDFVNNDNNPSDDHIWGHGTHVSGIAAAKGNNGKGITGIAWNAKLMPLKILNQNGAGYTSAAIEALDYAVNMGARISNNSWGGGFFSESLSQALDRANKQGHIFIAAAGNNYGNNNDEAPLYPASYPQENIISVGASDHADMVAVFSSIGTNSIDLFAPGFGMYSTLPDGKYGYFSGTSMSAPIVSGAVALLLSVKPQLDVSNIKREVIQSVDKIPSMLLTCKSGGRINVARLLNNECDVDAYFEVSNLYQCKGDTITVPNLSNNARSYQWYLDDQKISDQFSPQIILNGDDENGDDDEENTRVLTLIATGDKCIDTFQQELSLVEQPNIQDIDTTHCGEIINISSPLSSPFFSYNWYDSASTLVGTSESLEINRSGAYQLEIIYQCQSNIPVNNTNDDDGNDNDGNDNDGNDDDGNDDDGDDDDGNDDDGDDDDGDDDDGNDDDGNDDDGNDDDGNDDDGNDDDGDDDDGNDDDGDDDDGNDDDGDDDDGNDDDGDDDDGNDDDGDDDDNGINGISTYTVRSNGSRILPVMAIDEQEPGLHSMQNQLNPGLTSSTSRQADERGDFSYSFNIPVRVSLLSNCVRPGDANADGEVGMDDYLITGLIEGETGPPRENASTEYIPQSGNLWPGSFAMTNSFANQANYMHADADGNGIINLEKEKSIIRKNFNNKTLPRQNVNGTLEISLDLEDGTTQLGDTTDFTVNLNTFNDEVLDAIAGIAFKVEYDLPLNNPIGFDLSNSWFWEMGNTDTLVVTGQKKRSVCVGLLKKSQTNKSEDILGPLIRGRIIVIEDDIGNYGALAQRVFVSLSVTDIILMGYDGSSIPINLLGSSSSETLVVDLAQGESVSNTPGLYPVNPHVNIWPNPASHQLFLSSKEANTAPFRVEIFNAHGQIVLKRKFENTSKESVHQLSIQHMSPGNYWIKIFDQNHTSISPFQKH